MIFPGLLRPKRAAGPSSPRCSGPATTGGTVAWSEVVQQSFMGISGINPQPPPLPHRHGLHPGRPDPGQAAAPSREAGRRTPTRRTSPRRPRSRRRSTSIAIADLDLISEQFFELRRQQDREPGLRQRHVRAQLRRRPGRRRVVRRPAEAAAQAPDARPARGPDQGVHRGAPDGDQGGRGRGQGRSSTQAQKALRQAGRRGPEPQGPRRADQGDPARQPPGGRQPPARRREGRTSRTRSGARSSESKAETRAEDPRDPERRPAHGRRAPAAARRCSSACSSSASGSAARTTGPTRTGWPESSGAAAVSMAIADLKSESPIRHRPIRHVHPDRP